MTTTLKQKKLLKIILISKIVIGLIITAVSIVALYYRTWYLAIIAPLLFLIYCVLMGLGSKSKIIKGMEKVWSYKSLHSFDEIFFQSNPKISFFATVILFRPIILCIISCANCMIVIQDLHLLDYFDFLLPVGHPYISLAIKMTTSGVLMIILSRVAYLTSRKIRRAFDNPFSTVAARA